MKMLRVKIVVAFSKMLGVPIKVRESYWLGDGEVSSGTSAGGQTG
jgi:hypothetical protein